MQTVKAANSDGALAQEVLPTTDPFSGTTMDLTSALARQLGLSTSAPTADCSIQLSPSATWNWGASVASVANGINGVTTLIHEITEAMGRQCGSDTALAPAPLALFRYSAANVIDTSNAAAGGYFSLNGGAANLVSMGNTGGDIADFNNNDAFGLAISGSPDEVSQLDVQEVEASGYNATTGVKFGGGNAVTMSGATNNAAVFTDSGTTWDKASGSGGVVLLTNDQASVLGGGDTIMFYSGNATTENAASLYATGADWDTVNGSNATISLASAQGSVTGADDWIYLDGSTSDAVSLYATSGGWDNVIGSSGSITLTSAQANVTSGANWIYFDGSAADAVSLFSTGGFYDDVKGSNGTVILNGSQANVTGGGDRIYLDGSTLDAVSLYATNNVWDNVTGSNGAVALTSSQANVTGGGDFIYLSGAGATVSLYNASAVDIVTGSNARVIVNSSLAKLTGGANSIYLNGTGDVVTLGGTNGAADTVWGSNATVDVNASTATLNGSNDTINLLATSAQAAVTLSGASDTLNFNSASQGGVETVTGFVGSDVLNLPSAFVQSFAALTNPASQGQMTSSGGNTVITLASGATTQIITLVNVASSTLTANNFLFTAP